MVLLVSALANLVGVGITYKSLRPSEHPDPRDRYHCRIQTSLFSANDSIYFNKNVTEV